MKIRQYIYVLTVFAAVCLQGCVRDLTADYDIPYEDGLPAVISLNIEMPSMSVATRSDMPDNADSEVSSVWVGIFSAKTHKCTYAGFHNISLSSTHYTQSLTIKTLSGSSYIVAVGNPEDNYGLDGDGEFRELTTLLPGGSNSRVRTAEFSWDDYLDIAIRQLDLNDVNTPIGNLVMSGIYFDELNHEEKGVVDWETANYTPVNIKSGTSKLGGAIHLRRLISQVKFVIKAADYTLDEAGGRDNNNKSGHRIVEITPQSFQVKNVPYTSWLHERKSGSFGDDDYKKANSGDVIEVENLTDNGQRLPKKVNYRSSAWFSGSQYIEPKQEVNSEGNMEISRYEFDFWMLENKRRSSIPLGSGNEAYYNREKEYKTKETMSGNDSSYEIDENSGIYVSLCGSDPSELTTKDGGYLLSSKDEIAAKETMNNCATLVEIRCRILYTDDGLEDIRKDEDYKEVQYRSADAVYTVHLGGMNGDWDDFTHRRNYKYTYNVTIVDIDRIIVEGRYDTEDRPGIEGVVTDVVNPPFDVDCHYHKVNIRLSNRERTGRGIEERDGLNNGNSDNPDDRLNGNSKYPDGVFPFRVRYFDETNFARYIDPSNIHEYMDDEGQLYWTWIEFRPTTDSLTLAEYKPYNGTSGDTFRLNEVHDLEHFRHFQDTSGDDAGETQYWYTVFINEYVYETSNDESGNNWVNYVNLSARMCWINTLFRSSVDDESNYIRSKYVVRQPSIQTFYSVPSDYVNQDIDAIGMEHTNETLGFNLRWDGVTTSYQSYRFDNEAGKVSHSLKNNNGRHNTLLYIFGEPDTDGSGYSNAGRWGGGTWRPDPERPEWSNYVNDERLQVIEGLNLSSNQYGITDQIHGPAYLPNDYYENEAVYRAQGLYHPYYVSAINTYTNGRSLGVSDINTKNYLRILDACMNRNRDNNGNGVIDPEEIRWYVPASSEMVDLVLGRNSLETPLLDYEANYSLNSPPNHATEQPHQANTRFHYATSNARVLWAEEGTTINPESDVLDTWNLPPHNVRCVRALGTDLETDLNKDLSPAFNVDDEKFPTMIHPTFYEQKNQRAYTSNALEPHQEMTTLNRLCYYGFEFDKKLYGFDGRNIEIDVEETITYPKGYYKDGIQDMDHYVGPDAPLDLDWYKEHGYPKLLENGRLFKTNSSKDANGKSDGYYYRAIPGTKHNDWILGNIVIREGQDGSVTFREAGWYKIDKDQYLTGRDYSSSNMNDGEYVYSDEMWIGGTTHEAGWYKPDLSKGRFDTAQEDGGTVLWEDYTLYDEVYPAGYYFPNPDSYKAGGPDERPDETYEYFKGPLGTVWNMGGNYYLMGSAYKEYVFGYAYYEGASGQKWGDGFDGTPDSYYAVNFNTDATNAWVKGFWSGIELQPGWYTRGELLKYEDLNKPGVNDPDIPRFEVDVNIGEGKPVPDGYYYANESEKGNEGQAGYQYYPAWNQGGGEYYPKGWYKIVAYSKEEPADKDGYIYLEELSDYFARDARYDADYSIWSETPKPGYGQIEDGQPVIEIWTDDFVPGYYADEGWGEYLGTEPPTDPSAKQLNEKVVHTGKTHKETVQVGDEVPGEDYRLFVYHADNFVKNHGATLQVANDICREQHNGDRSWRLPNLKEASLIKIALDNAEIYKTNRVNNGNLTFKKDTENGYDIGNFLACTFREFGVDGGESRDDKTGYYTGVYYPEADNEAQAGDWLDEVGGTILGRICCITTDQNRHYYIRCVRDLRDGEFTK